MTASPTSKTGMRRALVTTGLLLALAGCGDDGEVTAGDDPPLTTSAPTPADPDQRYTATTTVLESSGHGPQLCLGGVAESYPPQCGGPDIVGWEWDAVEGEESSNGTTWGDYTVVGTWDGERLTLTEPATAPEPVTDDGGGDGGAMDLSTPCPPPDGGWAVVDPATATQEGLDAAIAYAQSQPEHAGVWVDQSINPASDDPMVDTGDPSGAALMNDPTLLILNLRFTGDPQAHEEAVREVWGGSLCLTAAERTQAELEQVQQELQEALDPLTLSIDETRGTMQAQVTVADPALQAELDERYGAGVVELVGALQPVG